MEINSSINNHEHPTKREQLSNGEVGNLLASFGNSEAKALLVADMHPEVIYGKTPLQKLINDTQGKNIPDGK